MDEANENKEAGGAMKFESEAMKVEEAVRDWSIHTPFGIYTFQWTDQQAQKFASDPTFHITIMGADKRPRMFIPKHLMGPVQLGKPSAIQPADAAAAEVLKRMEGQGGMRIARA